MASYILRQIDTDLWRQIKSRAALEGVSLKTLIERLLKQWLVSPRADGQPIDDTKGEEI